MKLRSFVTSRVVSVAGAAGSLAASGLALADASTVDVTAVTSALSGAGSTLSTIGAAIVGALVVAVIYKWVKGMMFG